jgi:hypothetical protein
MTGIPNGDRNMSKITHALNGKAIDPTAMYALVTISYEVTVVVDVNEFSALAALLSSSLVAEEYDGDYARPPRLRPVERELQVKLLKGEKLIERLTRPVPAKPAPADEDVAASQAE